MPDTWDFDGKLGDFIRRLFKKRLKLVEVKR